VPALTFGLVVGALEAMLAVSFAALVFAGPLSGELGAGVGLALVSAIVILVVVGLRSSLPGAVAAVQDSTAAILALVAAQIASEASAGGHEVFLTAVAAIALTTVAAGVFLLAIGLLGLGNLIRFVPYPVVGGFLAGTGWLLAKGAIGVLSGTSLSLATLGDVLKPDALARWAPGLALAVTVLVLARRFDHFLVIPGLIVASVALFYGLLAVTGTTVSEAEAGGWLLGPFPDAALWKPWTLEALGRADWSAVFAQLPNMATVVLVGVVALLLNTSGIELAVNRDLDLNRELRAAGVGNVIAGLGGGMVGFQSPSLSTLAYRAGAGRAVGLVAAGACALALFGGSSLSLLPRVVVGGLLLFLGLSFLLEWIYRGWFRLPRADYVVVLLIVAVIAVFGFLPGVGVGLVVAVTLFVVDYSRTDVVKHALTASSYRSTVERDEQQLGLQGFLFFGTANSLLEKIRTRAFDAARAPLSFLLLDFRRVTGLDSSAVIAFIKAHRLSDAQGFAVGVSSVSDRVRTQLERGGFASRSLAG
jgi:SulP family sulfate permease